MQVLSFINVDTHEGMEVMIGDPLVIRKSNEGHEFTNNVQTIYVPFSAGVIWMIDIKEMN